MFAIGCAKRGSITGGLKDSIAPVLKMGFPKNFSTNFTAKEIKLTFDEYIKLKVEFDRLEKESKAFKEKISFRG